MPVGKGKANSVLILHNQEYHTLFSYINRTDMHKYWLTSYDLDILNKPVIECLSMGITHQSFVQYSFHSFTNNTRKNVFLSHLYIRVEWRISASQ